MATELFGGHFSAVLPPETQDVSKIREIPDNQEVFTQAQTDQSMIVEIMEFVEEPDEQALRTHFEELCESNDATGPDSQIVEAEAVSTEQLAMKDCGSAYYLLGRQHVSKFNEYAKNLVDVHMALLRLPQYSTDILVTFNDPTSIDPDSSSHQAVPTSAACWTVENFFTLVRSLKLLDPAIFGQ